MRGILWTAGIVVLLGAALEWYCRTPLSVELPALEVSTQQPLTLVFHGSVDAENPQFPRLLNALRQSREQVKFVRWDPWSDTRLRAAASAERVGELLAEQVLDLHVGASRPLELELIGHSSGAYVLDALCERLRSQANVLVTVRMIFIDPFQLRGFLDWRHGAREHGRCADEALAIINTDDPAPSTNRPLQRARNIDVTADPARTTFERNGHYWALEYLIRREAGL